MAAILASAIANQALTRRPLAKAAFNAGQYALAAAASAAVFVALARLGAPLLWATVPAPFVFSLVSQGSTALLFARLEGEPVGRVFRQRFLAWSATGAVAGLALGLAAYALWLVHPLATLAILPIFLLLTRFGRLTEWAEEELRVHKALAEVTTRVAVSGDFDGVADALLETCESVFGAGESRLRLALRPGEPREWSRRAAQGIGGQPMRAVIPGAGEGEIAVWPRPGQRRYGARDRNMLALVAASAASAARRHRSMLELREANQRLTNVNRELEEFTLWTTHDMREPLRSVGQLATILLEDFETLRPEEAKDLVRKIERSTETLKDRIKALHEFSRIVQEDAPFETVAMDDAWDAAIEGLRARIGERGAVVRRNGPLPVVRALGPRMEKVFANLVENALKHNDKPMPAVEVLCEDAGDAWEIVVRDNGPGIEPAFRERAFQLFQRGSGTREDGSGTGLAIVKRIVEQHGGSVWIDAAPGGGAEFRFTFPKGQGVREVPVLEEAGLYARVRELV